MCYLYTSQASVPAGPARFVAPPAPWAAGLCLGTGNAMSRCAHLSAAPPRSCSVDRCHVASPMILELSRASYRDRTGVSTLARWYAFPCNNDALGGGYLFKMDRYGPVQGSPLALNPRLFFTTPTKGVPATGLEPASSKLTTWGSTPLKLRKVDGPIPDSYVSTVQATVKRHQVGTGAGVGFDNAPRAKQCMASWHPPMVASHIGSCMVRIQRRATGGIRTPVKTRLEDGRLHPLGHGGIIVELSCCFATMAIGAPHIAFCYFFKYAIPCELPPGCLGDVEAFVSSHMIELQHYGIGLATIDAWAAG